jgi:glycosyltransferase involved in cell wall biosynthesis
LRLNKQFKKQLQQVVQQINPDFLIALSYFYADFICSIPCHAVKIVESHEPRAYTLSTQAYNLKLSLIKWGYMNLFRIIYLRRVECFADIIVTLTKGDAKLWQRANRIEITPNFTTINVIGHSSVHEKRVIAVGRLEWQKGFDRLIRAWIIVNKMHPDWQLSIFGSGSMEIELRYLIQQEKLHNANIFPFTKDISKEYLNSSIYALSSHYEGLPLVLIEAIQHGLPCVAFECPFGASDVIVDNQCGFIVDEGDIDTFAQRLCQLIESEELRKRFSNNALERSKSYDVKKVMAMWDSLFRELSIRI